MQFLTLVLVNFNKYFMLTITILNHWYVKLYPSFVFCCFPIHSFHPGHWTCVKLAISPILTWAPSPEKESTTYFFNHLHSLYNVTCTCFPRFDDLLPVQHDWNFGFSRYIHCLLLPILSWCPIQGES